MVGLVFVSKDNLKKFESKYNTKNKKYVIYNFIEKDEVLKKANAKINLEFENSSINFVTVARLVKQKAIGRLIKIHSKLIKEGYNHKFYIVGDGPKKEQLLNLIKEEKVETTFKLLGKKENPYPYIKFADYFCLLSYYEGYPMVLEEAKILNKKILITDTAARETVQNYDSSKIFGNTFNEIYEGLKDVIIQYKENSASDETNQKQYDNRELIEQIINVIEGK